MFILSDNNKTLLCNQISFSLFAVKLNSNKHNKSYLTTITVCEKLIMQKWVILISMIEKQNIMDVTWLGGNCPPCLNLNVNVRLSTSQHLWLHLHLKSTLAWTVAWHMNKSTLQGTIIACSIVLDMVKIHDTDNNCSRNSKRPLDE